MPGGVNEWVSLVINLICTWIALDFMDKGFQPKYSGRKRTAAWLLAATAYFLLLTLLNHLTDFEGIAGLSYGLPLFIYGVTALKGSRREMAAMSAAWVLIAFLGYYITASAVRMITGRSLDNLYQSSFQVYQYSMTAAILRLVMAKLVLAVKKKISGTSGEEELILAGAFTAIFLVANGIGFPKLLHKLFIRLMGIFQYVSKIFFVLKSMRLFLFLSSNKVNFSYRLSRSFVLMHWAIIRPINQSEAFASRGKC